MFCPAGQRVDQIVEQLKQKNVIELLSTTESTEVVINHEYIMMLLCDICLGTAGTEKMDDRAVRMTNHRCQDKNVTKIN